LINSVRIAFMIASESSSAGRREERARIPDMAAL
jgi:hypothetical protein